MCQLRILIPQNKVGALLLKLKRSSFKYVNLEIKYFKIIILILCILLKMVLINWGKSKKESGVFGCTAIGIRIAFEIKYETIK
jgi:hypothetical protein